MGARADPKSGLGLTAYINIAIISSNVAIHIVKQQGLLFVYHCGNREDQGQITKTIKLKHYLVKRNDALLAFDEVMF